VIAASQPVPISGVIGADARELSFLAMSSVLLYLDALRRGDRSPPIVLGIALVLGMAVAGTGEQYERLVTAAVTALGACAAFRFGWTIRHQLSWLEKACGILYLLALVCVRPRALYSDALWLNQLYYSMMLLKWAVLGASLRAQGVGSEEERSRSREHDSDRDESLRSHGADQH
jgi:hypothetical protein